MPRFWSKHLRTVQFPMGSQEIASAGAPFRSSLWAPPCRDRSVPFRVDTTRSPSSGTRPYVRSQPASFNLARTRVRVVLTGTRRGTPFFVTPRDRPARPDRDIPTRRSSTGPRPAGVAPRRWHPSEAATAMTNEKTKRRAARNHRKWTRIRDELAMMGWPDRSRASSKRVAGAPRTRIRSRNRTVRRRVRRGRRLCEPRR